MNQYIINEEELVWVPLELEKVIRSRPYNPQAEQCVVSTCVETIKRTRKDERNKTLDAVENDLSKLVTYNSGAIACIIKSLRGEP